MELVFKLHERESPQIKELRLLSENGNFGIYKIYTEWPGAPELNGYMRVIYSDDGFVIDALDFDGGPMIYVGYKLDKNNEIIRISRDKITNEFLITVQHNEISN